MFLIFTSTLKDGRPKYELKESIIGTNPGLGFRPMPPESNVESTLIWYEKQNTDYWIEELDRFLQSKLFHYLKLLNINLSFSLFNYDKVLTLMMAYLALIVKRRSQ